MNSSDVRAICKVFSKVLVVALAAPFLDGIGLDGIGLDGIGSVSVAAAEESRGPEYRELESQGVGFQEASQLTAALDALDLWVGDSENGDKWREFLQSPKLREQLALGGEADPSVVVRVLQQYQSNATGLDKRRFAAVRQRLQTWLGALRAQYAGDLAKLAWAARGDHVPVTNESLSLVRAKLSEAARRLENRLRSGSKLAQGWKTYLDWPSLEPHFSEKVTITGQSLRDLDIVLRRLRANIPGLEHPVFVSTADALESYRELAFWNALGKRRDTRPRYASFLLELEKQITRNSEQPTVESARQVGKVLGMLQQLGHSPELVAQVRKKFNLPNIWAKFSSDALQQLTQRPVSDTTPVRDVILGAQVRGIANSSGQLSLRTLPGKEHIAIELQLAGNIQSRTYSYKKPVRVGSLGSTNFVAAKQLQISDQRFLVLPASANARTKTVIRSIKKTGGKFGHRLIEKIAHKKVAESKPQAEYIAARHAERQVSDKFDRQVVEAVYEARQNYDRKLHPPLERLGMFPEDLHLSSTSAGVQLEATLASHKQISTDRLPPGVRTDNDMTLQLHESAINNLLPSMLAGAKIRQDNESEPPRLEGEVPAWLKKAAKNPKVKEQFVDASETGEQVEKSATKRSPFRAWSFLLHSDHPLSVSFHDQKITLRIRVAELMTLEEGEEILRKNWDFLVTYLVVQEGNRIILRRDGDVEALPTGFDPQWFGDSRWDEKLTGKQVGMVKNLEENINKRAAEGGGFPQEIPLPPIELPQANGGKQVLLLQDLDCSEGWLTLGYRLP